MQHPVQLLPPLPFPAGLRVDSKNQALQSGLSDALSAKNRGSARSGGLFGPEQMARLAMDPRGRPLIEDAEFMAKLKMVAQHPDFLNSMLGDPKMQLVSGGARSSLVVRDNFDLAAADACEQLSCRKGTCPCWSHDVNKDLSPIPPTSAVPLHQSPICCIITFGKLTNPIP